MPFRATFRGADAGWKEYRLPVYVQRIGSATVSMLPGTEGAYYPFWSPDGAYVAFFAGGKLKKVAIAGGPPQAIAEATSGRGGAWAKRGVIIYAPVASERRRHEPGATDSQALCGR